MNNSRTQWLISQVAGKIILDIGFVGKGREGWGLHHRFRKKNKDSLVVALDINKKALLRLKKRNTIAGSALYLPIKDNSIDTIVLGEVIEHFYRLDHLFREISRVLVRSGRLYLTTPNTYSLFRWLKHWFLAKPKSLSSYQNARSYLGDVNHKILWEPLSLISFLKQYRLEIVSLTTKGLGFPYLDFLREMDVPFWPFNRLGEYICLIAIKK